ncbi:hypothetical protein N0V88_000285 [Collariella sp. IMI 366227]|nr:hypothetical protein N0V88_000285 [Collariella sp. IMI 366227]
MPPHTTTDLLHAYRKLLRAGLRAVQFSQPSRSILTERLREGFRDQHGSFEPERVRRTIWFLNAAAGARGLEHKILKNLCRVHWERMREVRREYEHYERTVKMLNDSMGLCLR